MKEIDNGLGCVLTVIALGLLVFIAFHGPEIAARLLGTSC